MLNQKCFISISALLVLCMIFVLTVGCSNDQPKARTVLEQYLTNIKNGDNTAAYALISELDKKNISQELFNEWRQTVDKVVKMKSFTIGDNVDTFGNYEYMGTKFNIAYGFVVKCEQEVLIKNVETTNYDKDSFRIMAVNENGAYKVALLITDIGKTIDQYKKSIEKS